MDKSASEACSCAPCWIKKRSCPPEARISLTRRCDNCARRLSQTSLKVAPPFPISDIQQELYSKASRGSLLSLDTQGLNWNGLQVEITSSQRNNKPTIDISLVIDGHFTTDNESMIATLDEKVREHFSAELEGKDANSPLISQVVLAAGYAHMLGTTRETYELVYTFRGEILVKNDYEKYNLEAHLRSLLFHRFGDLTEKLMTAIRCEDYGPGAYAAAVILYDQIDFIRHNSANLEQHLKQWLSAIEEELLWRIRDGCRKFSHWSSPIKGSLKKSRRRSEVLTMKIYLHQHLPPIQQNWTTTIPEYCIDDGPPSSEDAMAQSLLLTLPSQYPALPMQAFNFAPIASLDLGYSDKQHQVPTINSHDSFGQVSPYSLMAADPSLPFHDSRNVTSLDPRKLHSWTANADSGQL